MIESLDDISATVMYQSTAIILELSLLHNESQVPYGLINLIKVYYKEEKGAREFVTERQSSIGSSPCRRHGLIPSTQGPHRQQDQSQALLQNYLLLPTAPTNYQVWTKRQNKSFKLKKLKNKNLGPER